MLEDNLFQVNIFGNFNDIEAKSESIIKLMPLLEKYSVLPNTIHELNPRFGPNPIPRLSFNTPNNDLVIEFGSERIAITKNNIRNVDFNFGNIEAFVGDAVFILDKIINSFNKKGTRISLVSDGLFPQTAPETLENIYTKYMAPIQYYNDNKPFEWNSRSVAHTTYNVSNIDEKVNVITEIGRVQGQFISGGTPQAFDRINLKFDINTIAQNTESRLTTESVENFLKLAIENRSFLLSQVERMISE
jgi:hypothetical protein